MKKLKLEVYFGPRDISFFGACKIILQLFAQDFGFCSQNLELFFVVCVSGSELESST